MFFRDISAIGFGEKRQMSYCTIRIEVEIEPQFDTPQVKIQGAGIVFHIHQELAPPFVGGVNIIFVEGHKDGRMSPGDLGIMYLMLPDEINLRYVSRPCMRLSMNRG